MDDDAQQLGPRIGAALRTHRHARGLSVADLARATGLSKTILGRIESGVGNPSVQTLFSIARALDLPLGALLEEPAAPRVRAIPRGTGDALALTCGHAFVLHADGRPRRCELFDLELAGGQDHVSTGHLAGTEEVVVCVRGTLRCGPVGEEVALRAGDTAWFVADGPHRYAAGRDARALNWISYPAAAPAS
ncbi:MAG: helix-turn-helix protein [Solirubrobacterales bacterium]|nr:helix-turn-helix protein [Solirubrobacterales bacterium]